MTIGSRMKEIRKSQNKKQLDLANYLHISTNAISMWETDKRCPDAAILKSISIFYGVSSDYLLGLTDDPAGAAVWELPEEDKLAQELFGYFELLSVPNKYRLIADALDMIEFQAGKGTDKEKKGSADVDKKVKAADRPLRNTVA